MKQKYIQKECKRCDCETEHILESRGYYRCKTCRQKNVQRRRHKLKRMAIEYKGGKCCRCGYNRCVAALEFHHRDESKKEFGIGQDGNTYSWDKTKKELDKCDLVCANCHRELHSNLK